MLKLQDKTGIWRAWIPSLFWLGIIAFESTSALSSENTAAILYPLFRFVFGLDFVHFVTWHFVLRKGGHVIGYAVLSILLFRAWRATIPVVGNPNWSIVWSTLAFFMTVLVGSLDEWHQTFLPSRTGTIRDALLDSSAGLAAQIFVFLWSRRWRTTESGSSVIPSILPSARDREPLHSSRRE